MLKPSDGLEGVKNFVLETVRMAGPNPCPPIVIGIGIGGSFDKAAYLAKKALIRPVNENNTDEFYGNLEKELLEEVYRNISYSYCRTSSCSKYKLSCY